MAEYIERSSILQKQTTMTEYDEGGWASESKVVRVEDIESIPAAADVVPVVPELRKTVELLRKEYENAKQNPIVRDPLAYAVYQVWKAVDGRRNGR